LRPIHADLRARGAFFGVGLSAGLGVRLGRGTKLGPKPDASGARAGRPARGWATGLSRLPSGSAARRMPERLETTGPLFGEDKHRAAVDALPDAGSGARGNPDRRQKLLEPAGGTREQLIVARKATAERFVNTLSPPLTAVTAWEPHRSIRHGLPVSTADELPGYEITEYVGAVFGVVDHSRRALPQAGVSLKSLVRVELTTPTNSLRDTRREAIERMVAKAQEQGADAVIALRFSIATVGDVTTHWSEVCAYGTAVRARKLAPSKMSTVELEDSGSALDRVLFASGAFRLIGGFVATGSGLAVSEELGSVITHSTVVAVLTGILVFANFWFAALAVDLLATIASAVRRSGSLSG
jgi:uncharacterized protein YbjQ (UPF0145 family)